MLVSSGMQLGQTMEHYLQQHLGIKAYAHLIYYPFAELKLPYQVKIWSERADKQSWDLLSALPQKDAATSVAFTSDATDHVLAVGLERGGLTVYRAEKGDPQIWNVTCQLESK